MQARSPRDLGLLIKDRRRSLSVSQAELAERIGASRHWVMSLEAGKPTVELGLVLRALTALALVCDVQPREQLTGARGSEVRTRVADDAAVPSDVAPGVDLSRVLSRTRASGRGTTTGRSAPRRGNGIERDQNDEPDVS